jgi:hypothetical protein
MTTAITEHDQHAGATTSTRYHYTRVVEIAGRTVPPASSAAST